MKTRNLFFEVFLRVVVSWHASIPQIHKILLNLHINVLFYSSWYILLEKLNNLYTGQPPSDKDPQETRLLYNQKAD